MVANDILILEVFFMIERLRGGLVCGPHSCCDSPSNRGKGGELPSEILLQLILC